MLLNDSIVQSSPLEESSSFEFPKPDSCKDSEMDSFWLASEHTDIMEASFHVSYGGCTPVEWFLDDLEEAEQLLLQLMS